jgi:shikimate kinase
VTRSTAIALIGLRGAGKSSVGRALAERLSCSFVDTDARVEGSLATSIRALFEAGEQERFRAAEEQALATSLAEGVGVIATGGGVVERATSRARLQDSFCVWLQAPPETLAARTAGGGRPSLLDGPSTETHDEWPELVEAREMLARRWRHYEACATLKVATERMSIEEVVDVVEHAWRRLSDNDLR